jgi:hypothetical protein
MTSGFGLPLALVALTTWFVTASGLLAASPAGDDASDPVYSGGGNFGGLNGGSGFSDWLNDSEVNDDLAGMFIGDSNSNGGGGGPGINSGENKSFGFYANSGGLSSGTRLFDGVLADNQSFIVDFDNDELDGESTVQGFGLRDADGVTRVEFFVRAGSSAYLINDGETDVDTGVSVTDGGLRLAFTITGEDTYDLSITDLATDSVTELAGRTLGGAPGSRIDRISMYNLNDAADASATKNLFVNNFSVTCASEAECSIVLAEGANPGCPDSDNVFTAPEGAESYTWSLENNTSGAIILGPDNQDVVVVYGGSNPGSYDLVLEMTVDGCDQLCELTVDVANASTPVADSNSPVCEGEDIVLTATEIPDATYTWVGPDFFLASEQNPVVVAATLAAAGEYSVSASVNGCPSDITTTMVEVNALPECLISGTDAVCPGSEQEIYFAPDDQVYYQWTLEGDAELISSDAGGFIRIVPAETGSYTLTLVIRDNSGCDVTCVKEVTIGDTTPPELYCPEDVTLEPGSDTSPDAVGQAEVSDLCDPEPVLTYEDQEFEGDCPGSVIIERTWTATDVYGNSDSCLQTIIVRDSEAPSMEIPPEMYAGCGDDTSPESLGFPVVTDNLDTEPVVSYTDEIYYIDCDYQYVIERLWVAEDVCGNTSEGIQTIIVDDNGRPEVTVPADASIAADADASPEALGYATAIDNCDPEPGVDFYDNVIESGCPGRYVIERVWVALDSCGNDTEAIQTITVGGEGAINLELPSDAAIGCDADTSVGTLGEATASDELGQPVSLDFADEIVPADCGGRYIILRTWTAQSECGDIAQAVQTIVVDDTTMPVVTAPADAAVACGADIGTAVLGEATAMDNCDSEPSVSFDDVIIDGICGSSYVIERVWRATDQCGNIGEAVQTITVQDLVPPEVIAPDHAVVACGGDTSPAALGTAVASDNCEPEIALTYRDVIVDGDCDGSYIIERVWRAEDGCGNAAEATQTITVQDTEAPVLSTPPDVTVGCGVSTDPANTGAATASDACSGVASLTYADDVDGTTISRTWTAVDGCGNRASAVQTIITSGGGNTPPIITSPGDQVVVVTCGQPVVFTVPTASSECDPNVTVVCQPASGTALGAGVNVITCTATDSAGNKSTATFSVTVLSPLRVVFQSPLKDDNKANNIETDADIVNKFKSGATVPHKIKLYDCNGVDVTAKMANLVDVKLDVSLRIYAQPSQSTLLLDVWEIYSGVGGPNGKMVFQGGQFQYNLRTLLYLPNTIAMPWFFRSHVTVAYKSAPNIIVGQEDALLESSLK